MPDICMMMIKHKYKHCYTPTLYSVSQTVPLSFSHVHVKLYAFHFHLSVFFFFLKPLYFCGFVQDLRQHRTWPAVETCFFRAEEQLKPCGNAGKCTQWCAHHNPQLAVKYNKSSQLSHSKNKSWGRREQGGQSGAEQKDENLLFTKSHRNPSFIGRGRIEVMDRQNKMRWR